VSDAPTLFGAPCSACAAAPAGGIGVVGVPSDWTHSSRLGARFGPDALRNATARMVRPADATLCDPERPGLWRWRVKDVLRDCGDAAILPEDVAATTEAVAAMTEAVSAAGAAPLTLGGDHYTSYPAALGVSRALTARDPDARLGYIQIDGHLDFADRLGAWGAYNHATNARRISELPNFSLKRMVWVGVSGWVDGGELALIEAGGGLVIPAATVRRDGPAATIRRALAHALDGADRLYLSLDIDAMDAGFLPGAGSIVHSGIRPRDYLTMLDALAGAPLAGVDIMECAPPLDPSGRTPAICAHMLLRLLWPRLLAPAETVA
jgi:agmatinase